MQVRESHHLLREYVEAASEEAFAAIVSRYIDLVYSTALRRLGASGHLAQDVTQIVFVDLAKLAKSLARNSMLGGWLHRHTCFVAATVLRSERRRLERERKALELDTLSSTSESSWKEVAPLLDDAIQKLKPSDREAIVLRFLEQRDYRSVGAALSLNEDAAQKRVARALEKLRILLTGRGIKLSAGALAALLGGQAITAAPTGLAISVCGVAAGAGFTTGASALFTSINLMVMTKLKMAAVSAVILAGVATPILVHQQAKQTLKERDDVLAAQRQQLASLQEDNATLMEKLSRQEYAEALSKKDHLELMRLRSEVGLLRNESQQLAKRRTQDQNNKETPMLTATNTPSQDFLGAASWANVGAQTPQAALQTFFWAAKYGDTNLVSNLIRWQKDASVPEFDGLTNIMQSLVPATAHWVSSLEGVRVLTEKMENPDTARLRVELTSSGGRIETRELQLALDGGEWMPLFHVWSPEEGSIQATVEVPLSPDLEPQ